MLTLIFIFLTFGLSTFFSASEASLLRLNRYEIQSEKESWSRNILLDLINRIDEVLIVILLGNTFGNILIASMLSVYLSENNFSAEILWLAPLILTLFLLIFAEVLPKTSATLEPKRVARICCWLLYPLLIALKPIIYIVKKINRVFLTSLGIQEEHDKSISFKEYKTMIADGLKKEQTSYQQMMLSALELHEMSINHVMRSVSKIEYIDIDDRWEVSYEKIEKTQHSVLPVIKGSFNKVLGFLYLQDCLGAILKKPNQNFNENLLKSLIKPGYFVPEKTLLSVQYQYFIKKKQRLGLVVNEYGEIIGLISIGDILNHLVMEDLFLLESFLEYKAHNEWIISGDMSLSSFRKLSGLTLTSKTATTVGGVLIERWERVPEVAEIYHEDTITYEIMQRNENQILKIRIQKQEH